MLRTYVKGHPHLLFSSFYLAYFTLTFLFSHPMFHGFLSLFQLHHGNIYQNLPSSPNPLCCLFLPPLFLPVDFCVRFSCDRDSPSTPLSSLSPLSVDFCVRFNCDKDSPSTLHSPNPLSSHFPFSDAIIRWFLCSFQLRQGIDQKLKRERENERPFRFLSLPLHCTVEQHRS